MEISNAGLALDAELVAASKKSGAPPTPAEDPTDGKTFVAAIQFTSAAPPRLLLARSSTQRPNRDDLHILSPGTHRRRCACRPDMCAGYCYFIPNRIHNEMETAQEFGFREPILVSPQRPFC